MKQRTVWRELPLITDDEPPAADPALRVGWRDFTGYVEADWFDCETRYVRVRWDNGSVTTFSGNRAPKLDDLQWL